jgi:hypothetical protein
MKNSTKPWNFGSKIHKSGVRCESKGVVSYDDFPLLKYFFPLSLVVPKRKTFFADILESSLENQSV